MYMAIVVATVSQGRTLVRKKTMDLHLTIIVNCQLSIVVAHVLQRRAQHFIALQRPKFFQQPGPQQRGY
jgi:hypothetical protein